MIFLTLFQLIATHSAILYVRYYKLLPTLAFAMQKCLYAGKGYRS